MQKIRSTKTSTEEARRDNSLTGWPGLALILLLGLAIRLLHISWGLPNIFEEATPLTTAMRFWDTERHKFDFNPHFFNYPAFTFYLTFVLQACYYLTGCAFGFFHEFSAFIHSFETDPTTFVILSRLLSIAFDVGTIITVFLLGKEVGGRKTALFAAVMISANFFLIRQAQQISVDTPLTFFCAISLLLTVYYQKHPTFGRIIILGTSVGLAASVKYTGALLLVPVAIACLFPLTPLKDSFPPAKRRLLHLFTAGLAAIIIFFACNPYILLSFSEFARDFRFEQTHMESGHLGIQQSQNSALYYVFHCFPAACGWSFVVVLVLTAVLILPRQWRPLLPLLSFCVIYLLVISSWKMRAERYILPSLPPLTVVCSFCVASSLFYLREKRPRFFPSGASRVVLPAVATLFLLEQALAIIPYHQAFSTPDTREVTKQWIQSHFPHGGVVATIPFGIEKLGASFRILTIPFDPYRPEGVTSFYNYHWYSDADLIVGSTYDLGRYREDSVHFKPFLSFYDSVRTWSEVVFSIEPSTRQNGPAIWLFRPTVLSRSFEAHPLSSLTQVPEQDRVDRFLRGLFNALVTKRLVPKAIEVGRILVDREPQNPISRRMLAIMLYNDGQLNESLRELDAVLHLRPGDLEALALRGDILFRTGHDMEARQSLEQALGAQAFMGIVYIDLATLYMRQGDRNRALALLRDYLQTVSPESREAQIANGIMQSLLRNEK